MPNSMRHTAPATRWVDAAGDRASPDLSAKRRHPAKTGVCVAILGLVFSTKRGVIADLGDMRKDMAIIDLAIVGTAARRHTGELDMSGDIEICA